MGTGSSALRTPTSQQETLANLLRDHVEVGEWGPRGPTRITVRDRRPLKGGTLASMLTVARKRPTEGEMTYTKNGKRVRVGRDSRGRFIEASWTLSR
jgi:hypothetical protein